MYSVILLAAMGVSPETPDALLRNRAGAGCAGYQQAPMYAIPMYRAGCTGTYTAAPSAGCYGNEAVVGFRRLFAGAQARREARQAARQTRREVRSSARVSAQPGYYASTPVVYSAPITVPMSVAAPAKQAQLDVKPAPGQMRARSASGVYVVPPMTAVRPSQVVRSAPRTYYRPLLSSMFCPNCPR